MLVNSGGSMQRIGLSELIVIFLVLLLLFGGKKLPEIGRAIGEAIKEFKKSLKGSDDDSNQANKG